MAEDTKKIVRTKVTEYIISLTKEYDIEYIGNNLNLFLNTEKMDEIILKNSDDDTTHHPRNIKSMLDSVRGNIFEDVLKILLDMYFKNTKNYRHIKITKPYKYECPEHVMELLKETQLYRLNTLPIKKIDADLLVYSEKYDDKLYIISVKGTARERIGQFLSNLFIFDDRVIKVKYGDKYYFSENKPKFKLSFVCFDMAKNKDFSDENEENILRKMRKSVKQMEVYLIDDDYYIGGGIYVLNNLYKLHKVGNFSNLVGNLKEFFK
jgi:hypothetical protein